MDSALSVSCPVHHPTETDSALPMPCRAASVGPSFATPPTLYPNRPGTRNLAGSHMRVKSIGWSDVVALTNPIIYTALDCTCTTRIQAVAHSLVILGFATISMPRSTGSQIKCVDPRTKTL